jgi:hypothetical protein
VIIEFTKAQADAVSHRLDLFDIFAQVFADTDGMEHLAGAADERAREMSVELYLTGAVTVDPGSELDEAILSDCIDGSTWVAVHDTTGADPRSVAGAIKSLTNAARKIEVAFGLPAGELSVPGG